MAANSLCAFADTRVNAAAQMHVRCNHRLLSLPLQSRCSVLQDPHACLHMRRAKWGRRSTRVRNETKKCPNETDAQCLQPKMFLSEAAAAFDTPRGNPRAPSFKETLQCPHLQDVCRGAHVRRTKCSTFTPTQDKARALHVTLAGHAQNPGTQAAPQTANSPRQLREQLGRRMPPLLADGVLELLRPHFFLLLCPRRTELAVQMVVNRRSCEIRASFGRRLVCAA